MQRMMATAACAALLLGSCAHRQHAAPTLTITAEACQKLADLYERPDIAAACRKGEDVAPLLEVLLGEAKARQQAAKDAGAE